MKIKAKNKSCIVVLGMHRSGTSLIAKGLDALGVYLGEKFVPTRSDNPKGFWENERIVELNNNILSYLGINLFGTKLISESEIKAIPDEYYSKAISIINSLQTKNVFGFKDPRTARLILFWIKVFQSLNLNVKYIIVIRNPTSVAYSLNKRDNLHLIHSKLLWLIHVLPSLYYILDEEKIIIDYDDFLESPFYFLNEISEFIFSKTIANEQTHFYINSFVDSSLRHNSYSCDNIQHYDDLLSLVNKTYNLLHRRGLKRDDYNQESFKFEIKILNKSLLLLEPIFELVNFQINEYDAIIWKIYNKNNEISLMMKHPLMKTLLDFGWLPGFKKLKRQILIVCNNTII